MDKELLPFDEKDLLRRIRSHDLDAFQQIYQHYAPRLAGKLLHLVKFEAIAQDLLQDIFMKVWEMRETIDPERSFGALLFKMATNRSLNVHRSSLREQNKLLHQEYLDRYSHIEEELAYREVQEVLHQALDRLTARQREIYILHKLEGKSYKEIAELLQISPSAINQHIQLASKQIKSFLQSQIGVVFLYLAINFAIN